MSVGATVDALRELSGGILSGDATLNGALAKIGGVDPDDTWDRLSGEVNHCGNIHDVCEGLARGWHVHVPLIVLARHESLDAFSVAVLVYGSASDPSIFGSSGGALVTYEASNGHGPLLSHVDLLVPGEAVCTC